MFYACTKKDNGPKVVQDIRGPIWLSDTEVRDGPPVGLYLALNSTPLMNFIREQAVVYMSQQEVLFTGDPKQAGSYTTIRIKRTKRK